jgi:polyphosphate kinase
VARADAAPVTEEARLLNRELSWLDYNARVLARAADPALPVLERSRSCAYFSSNLDEFFMVRVAGLRGQEEAGLVVRSPDGRTAQQTLAEIREHTLGLTEAQGKLWKRELRPALAYAGVVVADVEDCNRKELQELEQRFERDIYPILTPLAVGPGQPFPYISPLSLSLGLFVRSPETGEERFARVKVPELLPRFLKVGERGLFLPLERVIRHFLSRLFPDMEIGECCTFRVTRDADFEVSDEADDLLEAVQDELRRRRFGDVVRVEVSGSVSSRMLERLERGLSATSDQIYLIEGLLDLAELQELISIDRPDLKQEPWFPVAPLRFAVAASADELFAEIRRNDILVHHPFDSFTSSFEAFLKAAARDPAVVALKTALYRTSEDSPVVPALVEAAERGKQSVSLIELKARFDEDRNIGWSRSLEQAGVHVVYGFPNLKIHAKTTLVVRRERDELRRYVHLGTGNYNILTARTYEDYGLFTADPETAADVADLFNYLTGFSRPQAFRKLLVAPFGLREGLTQRIREVRQAAAEGKEARIRLKVNNLNDEQLIQELYRASQEGAKIDIVARSICTLRPGVAGLSERIRVRSILGRFLEHSRVFIFDAGDRRTILLGSADLMTRNLDHRIELVAPVEDARAQHELIRAFDVMLADNASAWELSSEGRWLKLRPKKGHRAKPSQQVFMRSARARARRAAPTGGTR